MDKRALDLTILRVCRLYFSFQSYILARKQPLKLARRSCSCNSNVEKFLKK